MNAKKILAGSMLTLATAGMATPAMADEQSHGHYSQNIEIIRDVCPTIQDIDVITIELLDEARTFQCNEVSKKSAVVDDSAAPALPVLGAVF